MNEIKLNAPAVETFQVVVTRPSRAKVWAVNVWKTTERHLSDYSGSVYVEHRREQTETVAVCKSLAEAVQVAEQTAPRRGGATVEIGYQWSK